MLSTKALARNNHPLLLADSAVNLPIRRSVALNIANQNHSGVMFELKEDMYEKLDLVLNLSLDPEFRAPSIKQVRLASMISAHLDLVPEVEILFSQKKTMKFIDKFYPAFQTMQFESGIE